MDNKLAAFTRLVGQRHDILMYYFVERRWKVVIGLRLKAVGVTTRRIKWCDPED